MVVHFGNLDKSTFREMGYRETVKDIPHPGYNQDAVTLTKTQIAVLFKIRNSSTGGFGQIRDYDGRTHRGVYRPSEQVAYNLEEKNVASVGKKEQTSRRTGRGSTGFEKKTEGGYVNARTNGDEVADAIANKLGYKRAKTDAAQKFMDEVLSNHPNA